MKKVLYLLCAALAFIANSTYAITSDVMIANLTILKSGVVTFTTLPNRGSGCNNLGQYANIKFVLNPTDPGRTFMYSALLNASMNAQQLTLTYSGACVAQVGVPTLTFPIPDQITFPD